MSASNSGRVNQRPSSMYTILPTVLQFRPFTLLQRSISDYGSRSRQQATCLTVHRPTTSEDLGREVAEMELIDPSQSERVGTGRKYAIQGSHLLNTALSEANLQDPQSQAFSRQLHISSMTYLLQGLPLELTEQEILHLQSALPTCLDRPPCPETTACQHNDRSILHRGIATLIVTLCLILRLALPYIKYFLALAHDYERTHHMTEKGLAMTISTVDSFSRKGASTVRTAMENKMVMATAIYCIEGVCGGLNEGLGEGMKVIDAQNGP